MEEMSGSSYASAAEDAVSASATATAAADDDDGHISELIARREKLAQQVAEQVHSTLSYIQ